MNGDLYRTFAIGKVTLRNRLYVAPHTTNFAEGNLVSDRYIAYQRERARGGAGLIITEGLRIHPSALRRFGIGGFHSAAPDRFALLADVIHAEGAKLFGQIVHTGRHDGSEFTATLGPSAVQWAAGAVIPHVMTQAEISRVILGFRQLTVVLVNSGFDGIEVHLGHGHLIQQFLSPATNMRTDSYGGTARNRQRLAREVLDVAFEAAGDVPVGIRISADEMLPGGLGVEDMVEFCGELLSDYPLAFLHVSHSAYSDEYSLSTQMADMSFATSHFSHFPKRFKAAFPDVPILAICRMDNVVNAARMLEQGVADLVGMARPHIADPAVARKGLTAERVRSCIACNQGCVARLEKTLPIRCVVNPEVGYETEWQQVPAPTAARRVLVIGGGPAGMEAAATAARRGHQVVLAEQASELGGQVNIFRNLLGRERWGLLVDELELDVKDAGVAVRLETGVSASLAANGQWDEIIVATGSRPAEPEVPGALTVWEATRRPDSLGCTVLVYDTEGFWPAAGLVAHLGLTGHRVFLVTPMQAPCANIDTYTRLSLFNRFSRGDVTIVPMRRISSVTPGAEVVVADTLNGAEQVLPGVDSIIVAPAQVANDELMRELTVMLPSTPIHIAGDAFAPRTTLEATFEGRSAGSMVGVTDITNWAGPPLRTPYVGPAYGGDLLGPGLSTLPVTPAGKVQESGTQ